MIFSSVKKVRNCVRNMAVRERFQYSLKLNDYRRYSMACKADECPWRMYSSRMSEVGGLKVMTYISQHTCEQRYVNKKATSSWIVKNF